MTMGWNTDKDIMGQVVPWWLGRARTDYIRLRFLLLPIPLNLFVAGLDRLYISMRNAGQGRLKVYSAGFDAGHKSGFDIGYEAGRASMKEEARALMKKHEVL